MIRRIKLEKINFVVVVVVVVEKQLILHLRFKAVVYTYFISSYVFVLFFGREIKSVHICFCYFLDDYIKQTCIMD